MSSDSDASGRASRRFARMLVSNRCAFCPATAICGADVSLAVLANVALVDRDATAERIEEAQQEVDDRRLTGAARADKRDLSSGLETEVQPVQDRLAVEIAGGHVLERDRRRGVRSRQRMRRVSDGRLTIDHLEDSAAGRHRRCELSRGLRQCRDAFERRECKQGQRRDEHAVEPAGVVRGDRRREDTDGGRPRDEERERVRDPRRERVPAGESDELAVGVSHALRRVFLAAEGDELGRAAQDLDELGGERAPGTGANGRAARAAPQASARRDRR